MNTSSHKTALITGASSGIGYELAWLFARDGYNLVLVARNEGKLEALASELQQKHGIKARVLAKDLAHPTAPQEIFEALERESVAVNVLVNNAGTGISGLFMETSLADTLSLMQVNMVALTQLMHLFLPNMVQQRAGKILNVASTAAFQPGPLMAVYYASKAYVLSFSEALTNESKGSGIVVTALCPGPTRTVFRQRAQMQDSKLVEWMLMDSRTVAEVGYRGLMRGRSVVVPGSTNKMLAVLSKHSPSRFVIPITRWLQEPKKEHL